MIIRTPDYYSEFKCIAGACTDTCCAGWQVDVDDRSFAYYKTITGEFGDRLASVMVEGKKGAEGQFRIRPDGRCPFLADNNLCDLYTALGEDALCKTCEQYPRYTSEYGNLREVGIAFSCKTAAEIMLKKRAVHGYVEVEDPDEFPQLNNIDATLFFKLVKDREKAYAIVADQSLPIRERMKKLLMMTDKTQAQTAKKSPLHDFKKIWHYYLKQMIIKPVWPEYARLVQELVYTENYYELLDEFLEYYSDREYEYENILNYFVYRYFLRGCLDGEVSKWVKLAVVSTLLIIHCDMACYLKNGKKLTFEDQVEIAHMYSREIEHSEENLAAIIKIFNKKSMFNTENLLTIL